MFFFLLSAQLSKLVWLWLATTQCRQKPKALHLSLTFTRQFFHRVLNKHSRRASFRKNSRLKNSNTFLQTLPHWWKAPLTFSKVIIFLYKHFVWKYFYTFIFSCGVHVCLSFCKIPATPFWLLTSISARLSQGSPLWKTTPPILMLKYLQRFPALSVIFSGAIRKIRSNICLKCLLIIQAPVGKVRNSWRQIIRIINLSNNNGAAPTAGLRPREKERKKQVKLLMAL